MKRVQIGPDEIFHRYLTPKWAFRPTSGAGAALDGGRFNRPGTEALYLSRAPETALLEYRQDSTIIPPATLAAFHVSLESVVDFSGGYGPKTWSTAWADWAGSWRRIARIDKVDPPSWRLADLIVATGCSGLLFPSLRHPGGVNLMVLIASLGARDRLAAHDPEGLLPRDQSSWPDA